jgi:hypothetical protein
MLDPKTLLSGIPAGLRDPLMDEYKGLTAEYAKRGWKHASLDGGRFCEVVYTILEGALTGAYAAVPKKPARFVDACHALTNRPKTTVVGDYSLRVLIPRVLPGMYEIRNNRNVGHVGGDVVANKMDADFVRETATWVMCELVRVFHAVDTKEAQAAIDALTERPSPALWEYEGIRRVLVPGVSARERALLLLYGQSGWTPVRTLAEWVKYGASFKRDVLEPLSGDALVELDARSDRVVITPTGSVQAERLLARFGSAEPGDAPQRVAPRRRRRRRRAALER